MKLTQKQILICSVLIALFLLLLIPTMRFLANKPLLPGDTPYYHLRISNYIKENGIPAEDPLIQRPYILQPYHLLLSLTSAIAHPQLLSLLIPLLCGLASVILFYFILKQLDIDSFRISLILLTLLFSPLFIFLFATSNQYALIMPLMLLGFYFFIKEKHFLIPSIMIFAVTPFFGILPSIISLLLIFIYSINHKEKLKSFYLILPITAIIFLAYHLPFLLHYGLPARTSFISSNILINILSDLGGNFGFGIFNLLLTFLGFYIIWRMKKQVTAYFILLFLIILSFFIPQLNIYFIFFAAIFAGYGFSAIIKMKWKIDLIKILTIILITCGLLFSTLSYINRIADSPPDNEIMQGLEWLKENSGTYDIIISHYTNGLWIESISERTPVLDSQISYIHSLNTRFNDTNTTFQSRNLKTTKFTLDKYGVDYVWIDNEMKQGQVWIKEDQGLLFLFRNKEEFKKVYSTENIEIWEYLS